MAFLEVKNLTHLYAKGTPFQTDAIEDVSFTAEKGEIIGVIGHTGSGKSTLLQHLNGLLKPNSGSIYIDGEDIWADPKKIKQIRFKVGFVFQYSEHQLFDETVYDDIAFGPKNMGLSQEEIDVTVKEAANLIGLDDALLNKSPFDLSGGEMRRAAIAGVLAMRPQIIVLDEPCAGLDPAGRDLLISRIIEYRNKTNAIVIIVSHSMEDIASIADKILVMSMGKLVMFDNTDKVFAQYDKLREIGLNVPIVSQILHKIKQNGIDIETDCFTVDDAYNSIISAAKKEGII